MSQCILYFSKIYVFWKPEILLTEVTIKISTEFKPFYYITQGFNQCILIDGSKPLWFIYLI